ncbi:MAG TPA: hypothetical protein VHO06_16555 [Polyangia bacterium]|nr:hypothetical protein [Polyangia bacterium]
MPPIHPWGRGSHAVGGDGRDHRLSEHAGAFLPGRAYGAPPAPTIGALRPAFGFSSDGKRIATSLGTTIDLDTGEGVDWKTGAPETVAPAVDPENLGAGASPSFIQFTPGDQWLLMVTYARSGGAPVTAQVELRGPATGAQIVSLFQGYSTDLLGYARSLDGRDLALGRTQAGTPAGDQPGLFVYDLATAAVLASGPTVTDTVLGLSPDGHALYTRDGATISVWLTSGHLDPAGTFTWPADAVFLGVAPGGQLVESDGRTTSWWDPNDGGVARALDYPLTALTWSADGRFGAGTGDPGALFHFWREGGGASLCAPPADTTVAPPIALSVPTGDRLYTPVGPDVAVWCR